MRDVERSVAEPFAAAQVRIDDVARRPVPRGRWVREWTKSFIIAFGLFLIIRTFLVEAFRIPTGSMESTLQVGDFLLVNKAVYGARIPFARGRTPAVAQPERGDIVVFLPPHEPDKNYVKRLIGMPGDVLEMHDKVLVVNGHEQAEDYVRFTDPVDVYSSGMFWQCGHTPAAAAGEACRPTRDNWGPIAVPDGSYFVMGDNRDDSEDSRYWGFVKRDAIRGRPLFVYYSFNPVSGRTAPWLSSVRWSRIGGGVQ